MGEVIGLDTWRDYDRALEACKSALLGDELVVYPTDTLYGLGANALHEQAVAKVEAAKGREGKPIAIIVSDLVMMREYADISDELVILLEQLLPGPYTILLRKKVNLPAAIAPAETVGVRVPHHAFVTTVVRQLGFPITATSANLSGGKSPFKVDEVPGEIADKCSVIVDGGPTRWQEGSTVVDFTKSPPEIVRRGAGIEELESIIH